MASRGGLRGYGLASGIELLTNLNLEHQKQDQEMKNKAIELYGKFQYEKQLKEMEYKSDLAKTLAGKGAPYTDPFTGKEMPAIPRLGREQDPVLDMYRQTVTMKNLQDLEAYNQAQQTKAKPASSGFFGIGAHPAIAGGPTVDTSSIRRGLAALQDDSFSGRGAMQMPEAMASTTINPAISQRIQQLRSKGISDQIIAQHLREKGIDPAQYGL